MPTNYRAFGVKEETLKGLLERRVEAEKTSMYLTDELSDDHRFNVDPSEFVVLIDNDKPWDPAEEQWWAFDAEEAGRLVKLHETDLDWFSWSTISATRLEYVFPPMYYFTFCPSE